MVEKAPEDPFELTDFDLTLIPKPTREIMFAMLGVDKTTALTPTDIKDQVKNLRALCGQIEWELTRWDRDKERYWKCLDRIETLIRENNVMTNIIRRRADQAARDRRREMLDAKVRSIPKWGVERKCG